MQVRVSWYYRIMLSYAPIFFVVISSLIFLFFTMLNNSSEQQYIATNRAIVHQAMRNTDASLQLIERNIVQSMYRDKTVQMFFTDRPRTVYDYYVIQKKMSELSASLPFDNTIYFYNDYERKVLSEAGMIMLDEFKDRSYIEASYRTDAGETWTAPRDFSQAILDDSRQTVVSLLKAYPYASDKQGAIVVNVRFDAMTAYMNQFHHSGAPIRLLDAQQQPFAGDAAEFPLVAHSDYTGWFYAGGGVGSSEFTVLSLFSDVWLIAVLAVIVGAIVWFTFITHINYKPLQSIMGKIDGFTARKSEELGIRSARKAFKFIETAVDQLLERSVGFDTLQKEDQALRQKNLFHELLSGLKTVDDEEWERQMTSFGKPHRYERLGVIALEIDRYADFTAAYSAGDQYLMKFLIETAFRELVQERRLAMWQVWMRPQQMAAVVHLRGQEQLETLCEQFRRWIDDHLALTVSVGIGAEAESIAHIADAYRNADENVSYKAVFGTNTVIDNRLRGSVASGDVYVNNRTMLEMVMLFRIDDAGWRAELERLFLELKRMLLSRTELNGFAHHLAHRLASDISQLPPDIQTLWTGRYKAEFEAAADGAETFDELQERLTPIISGLADAIWQERQSRTNHALALRMKEYIDRHYTDPDLSLVQVSDQYGLSPKHASSLFKEELGEKFIDYVLKVRFCHAKRMLIETDEPIQTIAERVGYTHVISFHRAFKKLFALPPGEYRTKFRLNGE